MTEFSTGDGIGSYDAGLIAVPGGRRFGIEEVVRLTVRPEAATSALPDLLGTLRGALPSGARLAMPFRLAVSTVRAGLGAIEEGLNTGGSGRVSVEITLTDGNALVARMPPELAATMERDRVVVLAALSRTTPAVVPSPDSPIPTESDGTAEALTSIFRYEKRNGRLRRISEPDRKA